MSAFLGLERNIVAVSAAMFLMGLGEELWKRYMPKYLEVLGAPVTAIGLYGTARDFLDGVYQYPGGWVADRYGRRQALLAVVSFAAIGYAIYWLAPSWPFVFVGLVFVMAWSSMASPTLFAVVGDALPRQRRAMGFTVQSILRRVPIVLAPTLGGLVIAASGVRQGVRVGLVVTVVLAIATFVVVRRVSIPLVVQHGPTNFLGVWKALPSRSGDFWPLTSSSGPARVWWTFSGAATRQRHRYLRATVRRAPLAYRWSHRYSVYIPAARMLT